MLAALAHRGPDGQGVCHLATVDGAYRVALGHRRLAIIDPAGAHQPMCDAGLVLAFNGEIYNFRALRDRLARCGHRFALDSDTEVLLRAYQEWGPDVVRHLRGMFAFAVWDSRSEELFMARDRFGEKPLFVARRGPDLYFASEIKALLRLPGFATSVDLAAVWDYLQYRYVPGPATLFAEIRKLAPGSCARWKDGAFAESVYWVPPDRCPGPERPPPRDAAAEFLARLDESVRLQMVSDVPFGAFLSGGIDSSTIVALMSRYRDRVMTFSVGFREVRYSELAYAAEVARHCRTEHHEIVVSHADMIECLAPLVACRDAPVSEPSDIAIHMLARSAARKVKMVLTGEGSDEVLGGYPKHVAERLAAPYQRLPALVRRGLIAPLAHVLPYDQRRLKTAIANLDLEDRQERYACWFGALNCAQRDELARVRPQASATRAARKAGARFDADPHASPLRQILYFDQTSWLPDNLLERADRMTMAASVEARVPFLDHELAEFVAGLPDRWRVRGLRGKWILREAARGLLPGRIVNRPKVGFRVPVNEWIRGPLRAFLLDHLRGVGSRTRDYYEPAALARVLAEHMNGRHNHEKLLWSLLNLELWHRRYA